MKVLITGAQGVIASIIIEVLSDRYDFLQVDVKDGASSECIKLDVAEEYDRLKFVSNGVEAIIHLAWDFTEDFPNYNIVPSNKKAVENIYRVAKDLGVPKVIMASSVHADDYQDYKGPLLATSKTAVPDTPYGASKLYIEALSRMYAVKHNIDVTVIRFGGVNLDDTVRYEEDPFYDKVLLFKEDCVNLIEKCLNKKNVQGSYCCLYAVSNNPGKLHSTDNNFGWKPICPK